jgi:hypothetical protein
MRGAIEFTKKSMGLTKEVAPSQVFDFSFAAKALAQQELSFKSIRAPLELLELLPI